MLICYRRDGSPYPAGKAGILEWAKDFEDTEQHVVRQETLADGYWISTVWIGIDLHLIPSGPPVIFETTVRNPEGEVTGYREGYSTEEEAIAGHMKVVEEYRHR